MKRKEKHQGKRIIMYCTLLVLILVFLFAFCRLIAAYKDYEKGRNLYDELRSDVIEKVNTSENREEKDEKSQEDYLPSVDIAALKKINKDVAAWIYMPNTDISYPVLQGVDNQQYLFQSYEKKYLTAGSIFLDYRCNKDLNDGHIIIYGHNMKDGSMFGKLDKYLKKNPALLDKLYLTRDGQNWLEYTFISGQTTYINDELFNLPKEKNTFLDYEQVLTLSTCTPDSSDEKRITLNYYLSNL